MAFLEQRSITNLCRSAFALSVKPTAYSLNLTLHKSAISFEVPLKENPILTWLIVQLKTFTFERSLPNKIPSPKFLNLQFLTILFFDSDENSIADEQSVKSQSSIAK